MRVTKVNGVKFKRNTGEGWLVDKENEIIDGVYKNIVQEKIDKIITKRFKDRLKQEMKLISEINEKDKIKRSKKIDKRNLIIGNILENFQFKNEYIDLHLINTSITKSLKDFESYVNSHISLKEEYNYSVKSESLLFPTIIQPLFEAKKIEDIKSKIQANKENIDAFYSMHAKFLKTQSKYLQKSINSNFIQTPKTNKQFKENLFTLLIASEQKFIDKIKALAKKYELNNLISQIKEVQDNIDYKDKRYFDKNKLVKSSLQSFQESVNIQDARENKTDLRFFDNEVVAYFHRHFPIRKKAGNPSTNKNVSNYLDYNVMLNEIAQTLKNKVLNSKIRQGAIIEYCNPKTPEECKLTNKDLEIMHIQDTFSRKLSSTITYATNTYRNEVFGKYMVKLLEDYINSMYLISDKSKKDLLKIFKENNANFELEINKIRHLFKKNTFNDIINSAGDTSKIKIFLDHYDKLIVEKNKIDKVISDIKLQSKEKDFLTEEDQDQIKNILCALLENKYISFLKREDSSKEDYLFAKSSIYAFRNWGFHYKEKINYNYLNNYTCEISKFKSAIENKIIAIPEQTIKKAITNCLFSYWEEDNVLCFYEKHRLYGTQKSEKMPSFKKMIRTISPLIKANLIDNKNDIVSNITCLNSDKAPYNDPSFSKATRYILKKLYIAYANEIKRMALKKLNSYLNNKTDLKTFPFTNLTTFKQNLSNLDKLEEKEIVALFQDMRSAIQKDRTIFNEAKNKEEGVIYDVENEIVALAFLNLLKEIPKERGLSIFKTDFNEFKEIKEKEENKILKTLKENPIDLTSYEEYQLNFSDPLIALYSMLLFLSKGRLSELKQNIISYHQACIDFELPETIFDSIAIADAIKLIDIVMATYEKDKASDTHYRYMLKKIFPNIEDTLKELNNALTKEIEGRDQLYIQKDGSSLVQFRQIIDADKEDILDRYTSYYKQNPITTKEVESFVKLEGKKIEDIIKAINKEKEKENSKDKSEKANTKTYTNAYIERQKYNRLKNRLLLSHISDMNLLLTDLYGRLVGLVAVYEKNITHLMLSLGNEVKDGKSIFNQMNTPKIPSHIYSLCGDSDCTDSEIFTRNKLAHFEFLRQTDAVKGINFLAQINNIRKLLRHDRKLKNAVTATIINTFDKHGFELRFKFDKHKAVSYSLKRKELTDKYLNKTTYEESIKDFMLKDYLLDMIKHVIFENCYEF